MKRREFLNNTVMVGTAVAVVPLSMLFVERAQETTQEFIEYSSDKINSLNDYAMGAILPSLASFAIYAYTQELMYVLLFIFLLLTAGIII
jgi:hypothetical protein|tara:strand:- start:345 stop:614 length:270 start_codon:yes stop_codon:yes gene_type:complete